MPDSESGGSANSGSAHHSGTVNNNDDDGASNKEESGGILSLETFDRIYVSQKDFDELIRKVDRAETEITLRPTKLQIAAWGLIGFGALLSPAAIIFVGILNIASSS